jgi:hypothetical protein
VLLPREEKESHVQPSITTMSMTEPFIDTELPCSHVIRRSRVRDGSAAIGSQFMMLCRRQVPSDGSTG